MTKQNFSLHANLGYDLPASLVVALVALPLCLGIALASGAPLFSGLIAGIVGGIIVGILSKSPLSVSGPAAGLTVIVLSAIQQLPTFETFLLAVCISGIIQMLLGILKAGLIGDFIPSSVIKGMLAAIGIILMLKQLPHAVGYDVNFAGDESFSQKDGSNTFLALSQMREYINEGAVIISTISLIFLFWWDKRQGKFRNFLRYVPGPLIVVLFGIAANALFKLYFPALVIGEQHLVSIPVAESVNDFLGQFRFPDFTAITNRNVWIIAITLALVASVETLLSIEAIDKLDKFKRNTPTNRELMAQGVGNITSGLIGGLPITSVIVRSSANHTAGARTKLSAITHGILLLAFVALIPNLLNYIPLSALAAVLIVLGYKLAKPEIFLSKYEKGLTHFVPFMVTIGAILITDLLIGIAVGVVVGAVFILIQNFRSAIMQIEENNNYLIRCKKDLFFIHKYELKYHLDKIPPDSSVLIDISRVNYIDLDNVEILNNFIVSAEFKNIKVTLKRSLSDQKGNIDKVLAI